MTIAPRIELEYRARFDECGADGDLRSSGYLRYAQEAAWVHSERAGFDRRWYAERGLTWLVRCAELDVLDGVEHGERFTVSTEVIGWRRVWARRRSELHEPGTGRIRAVAIIDWVLVGANGRPARVPRELADEFATRGVGGFTPARLELEEPPVERVMLRVSVRRQDLDPMAHVNNAIYLDYLEEALVTTAAPEAVTTEPRRYRLEYLSSAELRHALSADLWPSGGGWSYRLRDDGRRDIVRARVELDPSLWVGG